MTSEDYIVLQDQDDRPRQISHFSFWKIITLISSLTSILAVAPFIQASSHHSFLGTIILKSSKVMSLDELNDLITKKGVLVHSFSFTESEKVFGPSKATRKMMHIPENFNISIIWPTPDLGYFNLKSMTFAKGVLPYVPNFGAFSKLNGCKAQASTSISMYKQCLGMTPENPTIAIIVDPNDKDIEIASWGNYDLGFPQGIPQNGVSLTMEEKCLFVYEDYVRNMQDSLMHISRKIINDCNSGKLDIVPNEQIFDTFNGSDIDPASYNGRYGFETDLSQNKNITGGLNLVNFFPKDLIDGNALPNSSLWNEVVASFPPLSVKAIVFEEQGRKNAEKLQKLIAGHPPLFVLHTIGTLA